MTYDPASAAGDARLGQPGEDGELPAELAETLAGLGVDIGTVDTETVLAEERELEDDLARVMGERDGYLDALRRLQADFDNHRKRARREEIEVRERASEGVITDLLPVLDALDLAAAHSSGPVAVGTAVTGTGVANDATPAPTVDAAALGQIGTLLRDTLLRQGLERIDSVGVEFDPNVHDAVAHEPAEDGGGGGDAHATTVIDVLRAGYTLKGKVLRPAMVRVRG
jgi:molecular chaperone GrpE